MHKTVAFCLALFVSFAAGADENNEVRRRIFETYLQQAEQGDVNAQFIVASFYEGGEWVIKDLNQAFSWYEKAARGGHPLALRKTEERAAARTAVKAVETVVVEEKKSVPPPRERPKERPAPKERQAKVAAQPKPAKPAHAAPALKHPAEPAAPVKAKAAEPAPVKPPETPVVVAQAAMSEPPPPSFNIAQAVLGGQWSLSQRPAEILPSALVACLQSTTAEIVCFSQELTGNANDSGLTYTVKAVLNGFNNRDGRFNLHYVYNVSDVDSRPFAQPSGAPDADLAPSRGWREPGFRMECRLNDERSLSCARGDRKAVHHFVRK